VALDTSADAVPYELTPEASKNNAFCWRTWESPVHWRIRPPGTIGRPPAADRPDVAMKQTARIESLRALGIDPLHIPGLGSQRMLNMGRFAVTMPQRRA
jgi:hypothetical protein